MKKIFFSTVLFIGASIAVNAQNTIPTTTCTGAMRINDSLNVNKDIIAIGDITSKGEVTSTDTLRAKEDVIASKDIKVDGSVYVGDKLDVHGKINTNDALYIKNQPVIGILPPIGNPTTDPIYPPSIGGSPIQINFGPAQNVPFSTVCLEGDYNPWVPLTNNFGGQIQLFDNTGPGMNYNPGGSVLKMVTWGTKSSIDASGGSQGGLLMNYFCGQNIEMCTGGNGGTVIMGKRVSAAQSVKIGNDGTNNIDANTSLTINQNAPNANALKFRTYNNVQKLISIENNNFPNKSPFTVYGDGKTQIGVGQPKAGGSAANAMLSVDGLILAKEIKVAIANTHWADYVFDKEYKLMPIKEVEKYISKNKHLPEVPSTFEVENNGVDVVEINATMLKKIEELTLYLIEQNKRIEALEKQNSSLLSKIK